MEEGKTGTACVGTVNPQEDSETKDERVMNEILIIFCKSKFTVGHAKMILKMMDGKIEYNSEIKFKG